MLYATGLVLHVLKISHCPFRWRARVQARAASTGSACSASCIVWVQEELRRVAAALAQYRLAAAQGYDEAQNSLGSMYSEGDGVAQDRAEALRWYKLAAAQGLGIALNNVGMYYEEGLSVAADWVEALRWYKRGLEAGRSAAAC